MNQMPEYSAVVVAYNSEVHIARMVRGLETSLAGLSLEVIVVDNASGDRTSEAAAAAIGDGRVVRLEENVGYGRGANAGIELARGRYVLVLNDDVSLEESTVRLLRDALDSGDHIWLAAPALVDPDGERQVAARRYLPGLRDEVARIRDAIRPGSVRMDLPDSGPPVVVEFVLAACLMGRRETYLRLGGFSDAYFMLGEDIDICHRVKSMGGKVAYVPEAVVKHDQGLAEERRVRGHDFSVRMLDARDTYYRVWLSRGERSLVNLLRAIGPTDQPFRLRYHLPKVIYDGPSLSRYRKPGPLADGIDDASRSG